MPPLSARAIRVRTSEGWQDIAIQGAPGALGPPGPAGADGEPGAAGPSSYWVGPDTPPSTSYLWIDTDEPEVTPSVPQLVSALPGSPVDGQEIYFQSTAMAADGIAWHLRYRATASSVYKWEFLGGAPLYNLVAQNAGTASGTYTDLATPGPDVTVPLAGDYMVAQGCGAANSNVSQEAYMSYAVGATVASDVDVAKMAPSSAA